MFRTFINGFKVAFAENTNHFIYFLKRTPFLGKKIPDKLYEKTHAKMVLGIIKEILGIIGGFFGKALYLGLMIMLPAYLITRNIKHVLPVFFHIFFFLSLVLGPFMKTKILSKYNSRAFGMIILMRADAREYYLGQIIYENIIDFIYFLLPMIISGLVIGFSPLKAIIILLELISLKLIGEWMHLYIYDKGKIILNDKSVFMAIVIVGCLALAYVLPILKLTLSLGFLFNIFFIIVICLLGAASFIYLWKYKKYNLIAKTLLTKDSLFNMESIETDMRFGDVQLDEKKMTKDELNAKNYDNKEGYEYLNALFFLRHRRIMVNPIKRRVVFIAAVFLIFTCIIFFMPQNKGTVVKEILKSTPVFVFIMYVMSTGERTCKAMFYNCDVSLLRYAYYREGKVILSNFTSRLKRVVLLNIIPALALCLALSLLIIVSGSASSIIKLIPLLLSIICLSCFFSIHHLFMYYVFQPYTAELTVKSPLYKFMNGFIYVVSYACLQIKTSSYYFTLGVLGVTAVYIIAALIITYKLAPKTFKLK